MKPENNTELMEIYKRVEDLAKMLSDPQDGKTNAFILPFIWFECNLWVSG